MRFLPSHKTAAINHKCGSPATYYVLKYVEALARTTTITGAIVRDRIRDEAHALAAELNAKHA